MDRLRKADSCVDQNCVQFSFLGGVMDSWRKADSCADENCVQFSFLRGRMCGVTPIEDLVELVSPGAPTRGLR